MKNIISLLSLLAAAPTAWAVYAGVTKQPAFPMPSQVAVCAAGAIIIIALVVGDYLMAARQFNVTLRAVEAGREKLLIPLWWGWSLIALAVLAEIVLSLLVAIIPGLAPYAVLVFPMLTLSGAFAYNLRADLLERVAVRDKLRSKPPQTATQKPAPAPQVQPTAPQYKHTCNIPGCKKPQYNSKGAHMRANHPDLCKSSAIPVDETLLIRKSND